MKIRHIFHTEASEKWVELRCIISLRKSGGVQFYSIRTRKDGVSAFFDYKNFTAADNENSDYIRFIEWKEEIGSWPTIKSIDRHKSQLK